MRIIRDEEEARSILLAKEIARRLNARERVDVAQLRQEYGLSKTRGTDAGFYFSGHIEIVIHELAE